MAATPDLAALAQALAQGRSLDIDRMFRRAGLAPPLVVWRPERGELGHPTLRDFHARCLAVSAADGALRLEEFEALDLGGLADWLMVLEPLEDDDFRYLRYGPGIAAEYGRDMTGTCASAFDGHISVFFRALYAAATRVKHAVMSVHEPPRAVFVSAWRRLIVPVLDARAAVSRLVAVNAPDNDLRAGLEAIPEAVTVTTPEHQVVFANAAARLLFGDRRMPCDGLDLSGYTGFDLRLPDCETTQVVEGMERRGDLIVRYTATCKRITYRDRPYNVVMLRFS
jgi:PAS domain-containing protein